jgi:hypothetical protein
MSIRCLVPDLYQAQVQLSADFDCQMLLFNAATVMILYNLSYRRNLLGSILGSWDYPPLSSML